MLRTALIAALAALAPPALAAANVSVGLDLSGDSQIQTVVYGCGEGTEPLSVKYINAAPNFLAIVPIDGQELVFVNVISGSGAKYVAGQYEGWNKGSDATLHDVTEGLDAAPVLTCSENVQTP
jgi:membrane-bound inhibitor of C-type lysozyme